MSREIGIATTHCNFCGTWGTVALLRTTERDGLRIIEACETCWRATGNAANLLRLVRLGKAPKAKATPKKPRKSRTGQPEHVAPYQGPSKHEVGSLVPLAEQHQP